MQGMWAEREVPRMPAPMIREFEAVLDQENPDMFKWLTSQARLLASTVCAVWNPLLRGPRLRLPGSTLCARAAQHLMLRYLAIWPVKAGHT